MRAHGRRAGEVRCNAAQLGDNRHRGGERVQRGRDTSRRPRPRLAKKRQPRLRFWRGCLRLRMRLKTSWLGLKPISKSGERRVSELLNADLKRGTGAVWTMREKALSARSCGLETTKTALQQMRLIAALKAELPTKPKTRLARKAENALLKNERKP